MDISEEYEEEYIGGEDDGRTIELDGINLEAYCSGDEQTDESAEGFEQEIEFQDDSKQCFYGHQKEPIYALAVAKSYIISGGGDDCCHIWDPETGESLFFETVSQYKFTDTVSNVAVSHDEALFAAGSLSGHVAVWHFDFHQIQFMVSVDGPSDITCLQFHPRGYILMASGEDGTIYLWTLPSGNCLTVLTTDTFPVLKAFISPIFGKHIVSSSSDGTIKIWDPKSSSVIAKHTTGSPVNALCLYESEKMDLKLIVGGCEDGKILLLHGTTAALLAAKGDVHEFPIEAISCVEKDGNVFIITGCLGGVLAILEFPSLTVRNICTHPFGITVLKIVVCGSTPVVITGSTDGIVRIWDILTGTLLKSLYGHQDTLFDIVFIESSNHIVTASDDGCCLVFDFKLN